MNIFRNINQNKTAKEHIERRRNLNIFYDLSNNSSNKLACVKNKKITRFNNHSNLINISKGFFDYYQSGKCTDISNSLLSSYNIEQFPEDKCKLIKSGDDNTGKTLYAGLTLSTNNAPGAPIDTKITDPFIKKYSEINVDNMVGVTNDGNQFENIVRKQKVKCFKLHSAHVKNL
jgi:hypothetical protein